MADGTQNDVHAGSPNKVDAGTISLVCYLVYGSVVFGVSLIIKYPSLVISNEVRDLI